jgi:hypothetical protein
MGSIMYEKIQRTCRYGHGDLASLVEVTENAELIAFALSGMKFSIYAVSPSRGDPVLSGEPDPPSGYIVQMYKCPVCGYVELEDLTQGEILKLIREKEVANAVGRK